MKVTKYSISYDYVENVMLKLGRSIHEANEEFTDHEEGRFKNTRPLIYVYKRLRYLDHVIGCLDEIYKDVNDETKEIIKLLYIDNVGFGKTSVETGIKEKRLLFRHNLMVDEMMVLLGTISENESKKRIITRRNIPTQVKEEVKKRDNGKCTECDSKIDLHYHHVKRYADGGEDTVENLILLCVNCHAEEHKKESSYHLLKAMTKG